MTGQVDTIQPSRMNTVPDYKAAVASLQARRDLVLQMMGTVLTQGVHYGTIPNCGNKPSLFLPGAETLSSAFNFAPRYKKVITREGQHLMAETTCELYLPDGTFIGEGTSMCSTYESKYRYRGGSRLCPVCGKDSIITGKKEYGGGYVCFAKKGGCGAKFKDGDKAIEGQSLVKVENEDLADQWNTVIKMGAKRAFVHAVRTATGTADVFTQDIEDFRDSYGTVIDAEVLPPLPPTQEGTKQDPPPPPPPPPPAEPTVAIGWTLDANVKFNDFIADLKDIFKAGGHPEMLDGEKSKWMARKASDSTGKVLANLEARVATLKTAMAKAGAPANPPQEKGQSPTSDAQPVQTSNAKAEPAGPALGTPEYAAAASAALNAACGRFYRHFEAQGLGDEATLRGLVKDRRNLVMKTLTLSAEAHQDAKKMHLALAMQADADKTKVPA